MRNLLEIARFLAGSIGTLALLWTGGLDFDERNPLMPAFIGAAIIVGLLAACVEKEGPRDG